MASDICCFTRSNERWQVLLSYNQQTSDTGLGTLDVTDALLGAVVLVSSSLVFAAEAAGQITQIDDLRVDFRSSHGQQSRCHSSQSNLC